MSPQEKARAWADRLAERTELAWQQYYETYMEGYSTAVEDAAQRCEREAEALKRHEFFPGGYADVALSLANWIRALIQQTPQASEEK